MSELTARLRAAALLCWPLLLTAPWYLVTLSPGLSWANHGADSGDLLSALLLDTLPHPPGYPTWLLLLEGWLALPWPDAARATALASVVLTLAGLLIWHDVLRRYAADPWAGVAVLWLGLQPLVWSQAVIVEVYAAGLCGAALAWRLLLWSAAAGGRRLPLVLLGLLLGLLSGIHLTLLALLCGLSALYGRVPLRRLALTAGGLLVGCLVWLVLPWRGAPTTAAGWGDATTVDGFVWLAGAAIYREAVFGLDGPALLQRAADWLSSPPALLLVPALLPIAVGLRRWADGPLAARLLLLPALPIAVFAVGYARSDAAVLLIVPLTALSLPLARGLTQLTAGLPVRRATVLGAVLLLMLQLQAVWLRPAVDASASDDARRFALQVLDAAPPHALILSADDRTSFALTYLHHGERRRPDVVLVTAPLLRYDWYQRRLAASYPQLVLPGALPSGWDAVLVRRNSGLHYCRADVLQTPPLQCAAGR